MLSSPSFRSAFIFSINLLILSGLSLTSFQLAEALLSVFSWLYNYDCAAIQKYQEVSFIYNYSRFWYSFCNQPVLFAQHKNVNKLWNNNWIMHVHSSQLYRIHWETHGICLFLTNPSQIWDRHGFLPYS